MDTSTILLVGVAKDIGLDDLEAIMVQKEKVLGPVVSIGSGKISTGTGDPVDGTVIGYDTAKNPPASAPILKQCIGGNPPTVAGRSLVATGTCWVAGSKLMLAVLR
jgi:hypothetical protein